MPFSPELVIIDVDGTLVDSVPDLSFCVDEMMVALGKKPCGEAMVRNWVGNGVEKLVRRALAGDLEGACDETIFARAYPIFLELYSTHTAEKSTLYDGVVEGLDYLKSRDFSIACVTNKAARFTHPLLKHLGIFDDFQLVISGDTLKKQKPDPAPLLHAAKFFQTEPQKSLMVGDSQSDVKAARAAGFGIICVSYGYNHGEDIHKFKPDLVIDSLAELENYL